jgi:hypothetical protein
MQFEFEVKKVNVGLDRDGSRFVEWVIRTADLQAQAISYKVGKETVKLEVK